MIGSVFSSARTLARSAAPSQRIGAAVVAALVSGVGFLPLFGGPGYEHALASGILVPSAAAIATALDLSRAPANEGDSAPSPIACVGRGVASGLVFAGIAFLTAIVHGIVRVGFCDFWGGALTFGLTAFIGAVMGGVWGAIVGEIARGRRRRRLVAVTGALAAPILCVVVSVWRFYTSPMIFAFDPFVGFFSGTLYDTVIDPGPALLTYRLGSLCTLGAVTFLASILARNEAGKLFRESMRARPDLLARALLLALFTSASVGVLIKGSALGHWHTSPEIAEALGGTRVGPRCTVIFPDSERADTADLLLADCEQEIKSAEAAFGARGPERITAFFFRDAAEKKHFMGAGDTYIAKPWRAEVYLQMQGFPHPVLGHEIAHVVAGSFGRGPFRIAGALGGLWPNPGLIEGAAVAAAPDDDDLQDAQWARAMLDLDMLPSMQRIFSVGFLGESAAKSYTLAGAFVRWVMGRWGSATVRAWYAGASIEELTHQSWSELDGGFRADLAKYTLSPEAAAFARAKFGRPSVFGRTCPHVVDELRHQADRCRDQNQIDRAALMYARVLDRDAHDFSARFSRANLAMRYGDAARGREELRLFATDESTPRTWRDRAEETLADGDFLDGRYAEAKASYERLAARSLDEDAARTLEVKALGASDPQARAAVLSLLLGERHRPTDLLVAAVELGAWNRALHEPLSDYLIGRNLAQRGFYGPAAVYLDRVLEDGTLSLRITREVLRQRAICACALGDTKALTRVKELVEKSGAFEKTAGGRRASLERMLTRCDGVGGAALPSR